MTQDEIMQLAKDAGLRMDVRGTYFFVGFGELSDLLDSAITKEREACAKVVQTHLEASDDLRVKSTLASVLDYIKARGEQA
jgi:hypothetical protein